jgi:outer membrane protein assembly factor BamB
MVRRVLALSLVALACGSSTESPPASGACETCGPPAREDALGKADGSPVTYTVIFTSPRPGTELVDLAFNPDRPGEIWALGYGDDRTYVGTGVGDGPGTWQTLVDPAASHFMHRPPAIAWGANGFWATCGDNDNTQNDKRGDGTNQFFMGPSLFTSDLSIFAKATPGGLGSHYDMLHNTSFCRGIAHVEANWFWVFNGELGSLDKYNFAKDHGPGNDDHSDGEIYRYGQGQVKGVTGLSSHVVYDPSDKFLYVADTGNGRIVRLDTRSGTLGQSLQRRNEQLVAGGIMNDAVIELVVGPGVVERPSGIEVRGGTLFVTDAATSTFYAFDKAGNVKQKLATGLPARSLSGFTFGPDGKIWFTDRLKNQIVRIDP